MVAMSASRRVGELAIQRVRLHAGNVTLALAASLWQLHGGNLIGDESVLLHDGGGDVAGEGVGAIHDLVLSRT